MVANIIEYSRLLALDMVFSLWAESSFHLNEWLIVQDLAPIVQDQALKHDM